MNWQWQPVRGYESTVLCAQCVNGGIVNILHNSKFLTVCSEVKALCFDIQNVFVKCQLDDSYIQYVQNNNEWIKHCRVSYLLKDRWPTLVQEDKKLQFSW